MSLYAGLTSHDACDVSWIVLDHDGIFFRLTGIEMHTSARRMLIRESTVLGARTTVLQSAA